jgi:hypothetical protein
VRALVVGTTRTGHPADALVAVGLTRSDTIELDDDQFTRLSEATG